MNETFQHKEKKFVGEVNIFTWQSGSVCCEQSITCKKSKKGSEVLKIGYCDHNKCWTGLSDASAELGLHLGAPGWCFSGFILRF